MRYVKTIYYTLEHTVFLIWLPHVNVCTVSVLQRWEYLQPLDMFEFHIHTNFSFVRRLVETDRTDETAKWIEKIKLKWCGRFHCAIIHQGERWGVRKIREKIYASVIQFPQLKSRRPGFLYSFGTKFKSYNQKTPLISNALCHCNHLLNFTHSWLPNIHGRPSRVAVSET